MKKFILLLASFCLLHGQMRAADQPLLAIPGKVIYENKFDTALGKPWKVAKGKWELVDGAWRASEKSEDKHPGVARLPNKLGDVVIEYEFKWHKVRMEMVGDTMLGQVDNLTGWGQSDSLKQERTAGLTLGGQSVDFRSFKICAATLNPDWDHVKAGLGKPTSKN